MRPGGHRPDRHPGRVSPAYEVLAGNTLDKLTLTDFLAKIEAQYGKAERIWVMDRGLPSQAILALMGAADRPVHYLGGTPKGRLTKLEQSFLTKPWATVRDQVTIKPLDQDGERYVRWPAAPGARTRNGPCADGASSAFGDACRSCSARHHAATHSY